MKNRSIKPKAKTKYTDIDEYLEYAWMELGDVTKLKIVNPFDNEQWENPAVIPELIIETCRNPDYLHFFIKNILNVNILPYQGAVLNQLWHKLFPILIATRGGAKSFMLAIYCISRAVLHQGCRIVVVGASLRQSLVIYNYIQSIWDNAPVLRDIVGSSNHPKRDINMPFWSCGLSKIVFLPLGDGSTIRGQRACVHPNTLIETNHGLVRIKDCDKLMNNLFVNTGFNERQESPSHFVITKPIDAYKITTLGGYSIICSDIHKLYTQSGFKNVLDITTDDYLEFHNNYKFPTDKVVVDNIVIDEKLAWLMGVWISEGSISSKHSLAVQMTDFDTIQEIENKILDLWPNQYISKYNKEGYEDPRGWKCKPTRTIKICNLELREFLVKCGLERSKSINKIIPWVILQSPRSVIQSFLSGLFNGDGTCFLYKSKERNNNLGLAYYSSSEQLIDELQVLLSKFNIFITKGNRTSKISDNIQFHLRAYGNSAHKLYNILDVPKWKNIYEKSYKDYVIQKDRKELRVKSIEKLDGKHILYDFTIPEDHSFIGNCFRNHNTHIICDEFASINPQIFETVIRGFAATKSDGVFDTVKQKYKKRILQESSLSEEDKFVKQEIKTILKGNQIVIAGTASYQFNHFYKYYQDYRNIIEYGNNIEELRKKTQNSSIPDNLNPEDYSIIRIPYTKIPPDMMDENILMQGQMTMDKTIFDMEYNCIFPADSEGFFLATAIEAATVKPGYECVFGPKLKGLPDKEYIMGVDPASESDNFTINIIELNQGYRGIVYQWSTNRKTFEKLKREGFISDEITDYNTFFITHLRDLLRRFNVKMIVCDTGGGGINVRELLKDKHKMRPGDQVILDMDDEGSMHLTGLRILKMIEFSNYQWRRDAHYGLRHDIIHGILKFPYYNGADSIVASYNEDKVGKYVDRLDDCNYEIIELKTELTLIKHQQTPTGQEKWDVPDAKGIDAENMKKVLKKDRFTSLLLANWGCRLLKKENEVNEAGYNFVGGIARAFTPDVIKPGTPGYYGIGFNGLKNADKYNIYRNSPIETNNGGKIYY